MITSTRDGQTVSVPVSWYALQHSSGIKFHLAGLTEDALAFLHDDGLCEQ